MIRLTLKDYLLLKRKLSVGERPLLAVCGLNTLLSDRPQPLQIGHLIKLKIAHG